MNIFKKSISVISVCALVTGLMAGCGTNTKGTKTATIWMSVGHSKDFWEKKVEEYNKTEGKEIGLELVLECKTDDSYYQALDVSKQSNQLPEFFSEGGCNDIDELGIGYPISDLPGMEDIIEKYSALMQEAVHKKGDKIYALPFAMTTRGLIYNKDMFKAAGIVDENGEAKPPKTLDEVREYAKLLTDESKGKYGIVFPIKWTSWTYSDIESVAISSMGRGAYDPVTGTYDFSVYEPVLNMIMGIKEDKTYYPGAEGLDNDPARARFSAGNIGMKFAFSFDVGVFNDQFPMTADWGVAPLPVVDENTCYKQQATVGTSLMLSKTGVEKIGEEAAASVMKFFYSDDSIAELYKEGKELPCLWDIVKDVKLEDAKTGWEEFASMTKISTTSVLPMPTKLNDVETFRDLVINRIWTNGEKIAPLLEKYTETANKGVQAYKELHPDEDYSIYIDEEWAEKVRREAY